MSRPTHLLKHEHRVIEQSLRALDGICLRLRAGEHVPVEVLLVILEFFRDFAGGFHHAREEELLFPALELLGIRGEDGVLGLIRGEHEVEQELIAELELAIGQHDKGNPASAARFIAAATRFREHLIRHMEQEDAVLFKLAEDMMNETAKTRLTLALMDGAREYARYEPLAASLEKNWAM